MADAAIYFGADDLEFGPRGEERAEIANCLFYRGQFWATGAAHGDLYFVHGEWFLHAKRSGDCNVIR